MVNEKRVKNIFISPHQPNNHL